MGYSYESWSVSMGRVSLCYSRVARGIPTKSAHNYNIRVLNLSGSIPLRRQVGSTPSRFVVTARTVRMLRGRHFEWLIVVTYN